MNCRSTRRIFVRLAMAASIVCALGSVSPREASAAPAAAPQNTGPSFVYVITDNADTGPDAVGNTVAAYKRNRVTGQLSFIGAFPTGGKSGRVDGVGVSQDALVTDGQHLFAVNPGSNDISVFSILADGSLKLLHAPVPSGGVFPISIGFKGNLLYVANVGDGVTIPANFTGFYVQNGALTPIPASTITFSVGDRPTELVFNSTGTQLVGLHGAGTFVEAYSVGRDGRLTQTSSVPNQLVPIGARFSPVNPELLFIANGNLPGNTSFTLSKEGKLSEINTVLDQPAIDPCWVAFSHDGSLVWVSAFVSSSISLYSVASNGHIDHLSTLSTADVGAGSTDIALDSAGKFLYQVLVFSVPKIDILRVTGSTENGGVVSVGSIDLPPLSTPLGIVLLDR